MIDIGRYFKEGAIECYGSRPKPIFGIDDALAAALISSAIAAGSTAYGSSKSAENEKYAEQERERAHNQKMGGLKYDKNVRAVDTEQGQATISNALENGHKMIMQGRGEDAMLGGVKAGADAKNVVGKMMAQTYRGISAQDTANHKAARQEERNEISNYANQKAADYSMHGQTIANAASAMGNAAMQIGSGLASAKTSTPATASTSTTTSTPATSAATKAVGETPTSPNVGHDNEGNRYYKDGATVYKNGTGVGVYAPQFNKRYEDDQA